MKTVQVSHHYLPHIGGIELYIHRLVTSLEAEGILTEVLTTDYCTSRSHRNEKATYFKTHFAVMGNPLSLDFFNHLKNHEYDVLHLHGIWFLPCLIAAYFRRNARVITTIHGVYPDHAGWLTRTLLNLFKPFARYVLGKSNKIIVLSDNEKEKLERIFGPFPEKIVVIPNGVVIEPFVACPRAKTILFTGRIVAAKNPDLLLKAVALLDRKLRDYQVVFAGPVNSAYKNRLSRLSKKLGIQNPVRFVHEMDPTIELQKRKLLSLYQQAGVFVSLGSWEGLPTRLLEAMQFKVPIVAYASGATSELIDDNRNGLIIDSLDAVQLAEKLDRVLLDQALSDRLGEAARTTVEEKFDWDRLFGKISRVYKT